MKGVAGPLFPASCLLWRKYALVLVPCVQLDHWPAQTEEATMDWNREPKQVLSPASRLCQVSVTVVTGLINTGPWRNLSPRLRESEKSLCVPMFREVCAWSPKAKRYGTTKNVFLSCYQVMPGFILFYFFFLLEMKSSILLRLLLRSWTVKPSSKVGMFSDSPVQPHIAMRTWKVTLCDRRNEF